MAKKPIPPGAGECITIDQFLSVVGFFALFAAAVYTIVFTFSYFYTLNKNIHGLTKTMESVQYCAFVNYDHDKFTGCLQDSLYKYDQNRLDY